MLWVLAQHRRECVAVQTEVERVAGLRCAADHFTEYLVNAPPACVSEFGPSAA
jgi:hypothetical protein